jgi:hypothetical protein
MQILEINALRFGAVKHTRENGVHVLNIHHGINESFSHFLASAHQRMAEDLSLKMTLTNSDNNMICMHIEEPKIID